MSSEAKPTTAAVKLAAVFHRVFREGTEIGALAYAVFIACLLPAGVPAIGDDFGYYRSVVETLQHHRPWTNDWLEPWSASLSLLSSGIFLATKSFLLATSGLLPVLGGLGFWAGCGLLRDRGLSRGRALGLAWLVLSFPLALPKAIEFNSWALHVPCLLLALWAAERRRWIWFGIAWWVALSNRQTAIVWAVLPLAIAWRSARTRGATGSPRSWLAPLSIVGLGFGLFALLYVGMNKTDAQQFVTETQMREFVSALGHFSGLGWYGAKLALGVSILILATALGGWLQTPPNWRPGRALLLRTVVAGAIVATVLVAASRVKINYPAFKGELAGAYLGLVFSIALFAWCGGTVRAVAWPVVATAAAGIAAISVHVHLMPHYFVEAALLGFFASRPSPDVDGRVSPSAAPARALNDWGAKTAVVVLALSHAFWALNAKVKFDLLLAQVELIEPALRSGRLRYAELERGPVGLTNWRIVPYSHAHRGEPPLAIAARFSPPLGERRGQATVKLLLPTPLRALPGLESPLSAAPDEIVARKTFRCAWFFRGELLLVRPAGSRDAAAEIRDPPDFQPQNFPLNDAEWREFIATQPGSGVHVPRPLPAPRIPAPSDR